MFCCVDNDNGNQNCEAQMGGRQPSKGDLIRAILGAHRTMLTRMGRYTVRPGELTRVPVSRVQR